MLGLSVNASQSVCQKKESPYARKRDRWFGIFHDHVSSWGRLSAFGLVVKQGEAYQEHTTASIAEIALGLSTTCTIRVTLEQRSLVFYQGRPYDLIAADTAAIHSRPNCIPGMFHQLH